MQKRITQSVNTAHLECCIEVLLSYSPGEEELRDNRAVLEREFAELGDNRLLYIAWEDSRPVGVVQLLLRHADNDPQLADGVTVAHVHHLRVRHDRRRQGIGRRLMEFVERGARQMGYRRLTLGVDSWNPDAMAFYRSLGYESLKDEPGPLPGTMLYYLKRDLV